MASNADVKSLVDEITTLGQSISNNATNDAEEQRRVLKAATKKLGFALELPRETVQRISWGVKSL